MKTLLSAPQKDGHLVSKTVDKGLLYWGWQYCIRGYGQFIEVSPVQSVLMKVGLHKSRHLTLLWITTVKRYSVFCNVNTKAVTESAMGFARLWILPEVYREPRRSAQMVVMEIVVLGKGQEGLLYCLSSGQQSSWRREEKQQLRCC